MYEAKILARQGMRKGQIAQMLQVNRRTVYNYLNDRVFSGAQSRGRPVGVSKLSPFYPLIEERLEDDFFLNGDVLYRQLKGGGYQGGITILRDYLRRRRDELNQRAIIRFETCPGQQAQVDWGEVGYVFEDGRMKKRYVFVMKLGYSRRSYVEFTTSMEQAVLFACMKRAFAYFGGVPHEILFDNMKTAFIYDKTQLRWIVNEKMLTFAQHYGFTPRRCRVRRPQTKGKVEREIRYLKWSFFPTICVAGQHRSSIATDELNEAVLEWLARVDQRVLRELNQSRTERFVEDHKHLQALPADAFDHRKDVTVQVGRDGIVRYESSRYSVHANYRGKTLQGKIDPDTGVMELLHQGQTVKSLHLFPKGSKGSMFDTTDRKSMWDAWHKEQLRDKQLMRKHAQRKKQQAEQNNIIIHPDIFDRVFGVIEADKGVA